METLVDWWLALIALLVSDPSVSAPLIIVWVGGLLAMRRLLRAIDEEEEGPSSEEDATSGRQS